MERGLGIHLQGGAGKPGVAAKAFGSGGVANGNRQGVDASGFQLRQLWCQGLSDLEAQAELCNRYMDCSAWGPPPWSAEQWQTLRVVLEVAI